MWCRNKHVTALAIIVCVVAFLTIVTALYDLMELAMGNGQTYRNCVRAMVAAGLEIAKDDPDLLTGEFAGFAAVMWHDDSDPYLKELGQDGYSSALLEAWHRLRGVIT
jgi:hypothetical protein